MNIHQADTPDIVAVAPLIAKFRVELKGFKGLHSHENIAAAAEEFTEYLQAGFPIFCCSVDGACVGYLVCRVVDSVVWVESLYVLPEHRKKGVASALFETAEKLAESLHGDTLYNYVHPNNHAMIQFLAKRGYTVLNLIEIRKRYSGELTHEKIRVGENEFDY